VLDDSDLTVTEITSADGSTSALFEVQDEVDNATPAKSELIFNKYGNRNFLAKLFDEGNPNGSQVVKSHYEKRVGQAAAEAQAHVPAHRQTIGNNKQISGPLKQQLPERQPAVLSRAKSFVSESQKRTGVLKFAHCVTVVDTSADRLGERLALVERPTRILLLEQLVCFFLRLTHVHPVRSSLHKHCVRPGHRPIKITSRDDDLAARTDRRILFLYTNKTQKIRGI
jgi:hypothetical protein